MFKEIDEILLSPKYMEQRAYWVNKLSPGIEKTKLPFIPGRDRETEKKIENMEILIPDELFTQLMRLAKRSDLSLYLILLTALKLLIYRYTNNEDVIVVSPVYKKNMTAETLNDRVFIRDGINGELTFIELLLKIRKSVLEAYENQDYPSDKLIKFLFGSNTPQNQTNHPDLISDIGCLLLNIHDSKVIEPGQDRLIFSLEREENSLKGHILFDRSVYERGYIQLISKHFVKILESSTRDINTKLSVIPFSLKEEEKQFIVDYNQTRAEYPKEKTLVELFEDQVEKAPGNLAIVYKESRLTYMELNEKANRLARRLKEKHVESGSIVGLMMERSVEVLIALFAVLKSGGAFLPIDDEYPEARKQFILKESKTRVLITQRHIYEKEKQKMQHFAVEEIICADDEDNYTGEAVNLEALHNPMDPAYIIYTSGTSGKPKGVLINHQAIVNYTWWAAQKYVKKECVNFPLYTSISFDLTMTSIFTPLLTGNTIVVYGEGEKAVLVERVIEEDKVGVVKLTPSHLKLIRYKEGQISSAPGKIKRFIVGGEELERELALEITRKYNGKIELYNEYGPTEAAVGCMIHRFDPGEETGKAVPLGKPAANTQIYILDNQLKPVPPGVSGELCIGGDGLAAGYLNRPELTAEKFVTNDQPFTHHSRLTNHRLYRTGDMAKWLLNGNIEFLGRMDKQVKISGFRIELGEIERRLIKHEKIKEVVVITGEERKGIGAAEGNEMGGKYLCAYIVSDNELEVSELREYLLKTLPGYMIPSYFVHLEKIPLTLNGKVDTKALPPPGLKSGTEYAAPRNLLEERTVEIWSEVLGVEKGIISIDANFFEIGGNSLKATILMAKIHKALNKKVPLEELFKTPTIRGLAEFMKGLKEDRFSSIEPAEEKKFYRLSSAQKRLYVLQQMELESTGYNIPQVLVLEGTLDKGKLEATFKTMIKRHDSLRTSFEMINEEPVQKIHPEAEFEIKYYKETVNGQWSLAIGEESLSHLSPSPHSAHSFYSPEDIIKNFVRPFDLSYAPLMRVGLIKEREKRHILMVDMHHIITDGTSMDLFVKEFVFLYAGGELPALRLQYKDYAEWQNSEMQKEAIQQQEDYWLKQFADEIPVLNLPTNFSRPNVQSFEGSKLSFELSIRNSRGLNELALNTGTTLYMVLLAIFNIFLSKISDQEDIVVGTPIEGRRHVDLERIIGMFVNTLAMRNYPLGSKTFEDFLGELKVRTLEAFENQEYQFEDLVENVAVSRDVSRNPLFDVVFALPNMEAQAGGIPMPQIPELKVIPDESEIRTAKFDLILTCVEKGDQLHFIVEYCTKLFKKETIQRFMTYFEEIVSSVSRNPRKDISEIEILSKEEKQQVLFGFNNTKTTYPTDKTIHQLFEEQVERTWDYIAVIGEAHGAGCCALSYKKLNEKSNQLAHDLKEKGVKPGTIVGIMAERFLEMIIGILGILKAGGVYLPIDPQYPGERIEYMLTDSGANVLVTTGIPAEEGNRAKRYEGEIIFLDVGTGGHRSLQHVPPATCNLQPAANPTNLAYVIYTSGSTGQPKGVMIEHRSVLNRLNWMQRFYPIGSRDRILQKTPFIFDVSVWELFWWGQVGASVYFLPPGQEKDPEAISETVQQQCITVMHFVPSMLSSFLEFLEAAPVERQSTPGRGLAPLRRVFASGEALTVHHVETFNRLLYETGGTELINLYGPTEATVDVSYYRCSPGRQVATIPIGKPIDNIRLYVCTKDRRLQPVGIVGELYIGGVGVGRGYLNNPELTAEKFDQNFWDYQDEKEKKKRKVKYSFTSLPLYPSTSLYRTGDLARWLWNGNIEFLGRIDHQVKIRGFRIELGEIEAQLLKHQGIKKVVVISRNGENGDRCLCAYIVPAIDSQEGNRKMPGPTEWGDFLSRELPGYMIPSYFMQIDEVPLTPNGKLDRRALPVPGLKGKNRTAPGNELEKRLVEIWEEVLLGRKEQEATGTIGIDSNFFEMGGHSLKAITLSLRLHKELNIRVPLKEIFTKPTIRKLATYIAGTTKNNYHRYRPIEAVEKKDYYKVSPAQQRLFTIYRMAPRSSAYNLPQVVELIDKPGRDKLEDIFRKLIRRHEGLRTSFHFISEEVVQKIHDADDVTFAVESYEAQKENMDVQDIIQNFVKPFDLNQPPLIRVGLIKMGGDRSLLAVDMHHIITDAVSSRIMVLDFTALYRGQGLPPLRIQHKDYSQWLDSKENQEAIKQQEAYWLKEFADQIPVLKIPTDYSRPSRYIFEGSSISFTVPEKEANALHKMALEEGATLYMIFLSVYNILLSNLSNRDDIVVITPVVGRPHTDLQDIIGMFANTLAFRNYPNREKTFTAFLGEVKEHTLKALDNQDYPFDKLVEKIKVARDPGHHPLSDFGFTFQDIEIESESNYNDTSCDKQKQYSYENPTTKFDLSFVGYSLGERLTITFEYSSRLFKKSTIQRFIEYYEDILRQVIENRDSKLKDIKVSHDLGIANISTPKMDFSFGG